MLTPEDVKTKQDTLQANNEQHVKQILQLIDTDSDRIMVEGIHSGTFNSKGGTIKFPNLGACLTEPQRSMLNMAARKFFESHGWIVDKMETNKGSTEEAPIRNASMEVRLVARYKKSVE